VEIAEAVVVLVAVSAVASPKRRMRHEAAC
jgi:hypothetical protein